MDDGDDGCILRITNESRGYINQIEIVKKASLHTTPQQWKVRTVQSYKMSLVFVLVLQVCLFWNTLG